MKMNGPIQVFETSKEAVNFLYAYAKKYDLSYIPLEYKEDILYDALGSVNFDILLEEVAWASSDIRHALDKEVGWLLLRYLEWKAKNPGSLEDE